MDEHPRSQGRRRFAVATAAWSALGTTAARAQAGWPSRPIRMLVPFPPGGVSDSSARLVAEHLSRRLGQQVVVDSRPGASGNVAGQQLVQSEPDGYTILLGYNGLMTINPFIIQKMPFDTVRDMTPIAKIGDYPSILTVHPSVGARTLGELIALSRTRPDGLTYGTSGPGSVEHLLALMLVQRTGARLVHIPYKGAGPALTDAMAGHIPIAITSVAGGAQHVRSGKLHGIAVSSARRSPSAPDVPTFIESGVPNFVVNSWIGLIAPARTPRAVIERINGELNAALAAGDLHDRLVGLGIDVAPASPEAFVDEIRRDLDTLGPVVREANIRAE